MHSPGATVGVMNYSFGNFKLQVASLPALVSSGLVRTVAATPGSNDLTVASFNVENLSPGNPASKFANLATLVVNNLLAPDLIAVEEIQDNNGATDDGVVDATTTYNTLIAAIAAAGGPTYQFRQIDPVNDQDGGQPGGNIRQGFLFRTDRGLAFVDRPGGTTSATTVKDDAGTPRLSASPGRIDPANAAWTASRKPLVAEFTYHGQTLFIIANHLIAKVGDDPLFGHHQPPIFATEPERKLQAQVLHDFVNSVLQIDPAANVLVIGDLNDFQFSTSLSILVGSGTPVLSDLVNALPESERYSYDFQGNSETLDHILASPHLAGQCVLQPIHVNAEFADQASDHDPMVARVTVVADTTPPVITPSVQGTLGGGGWYTSDVSVTWSVADPESKVTSTAGCGPTTLIADTAGVTLTCTATSSGGTASVSKTIKIDRTPPEVFSQFDPVAHDLQVFGRDAGSGVPSTPLSPVVSSSARWTDDDDADNDHSWPVFDPDRRAQLRTYTAVDAAGNSTTLTLKVRVGVLIVRARDLTLQYNTATPTNLPLNVSLFAWLPKANGNLAFLLQHEVVLGASASDTQVVDATFDAASNATRIIASRPKPGVDQNGAAARLLVGFDDRDLGLRLAQQGAQRFDAGAAQRDAAEADEAARGAGAARFERIEAAPAARAAARWPAPFGDLSGELAMLDEAIDGMPGLGRFGDDRVGARRQRRATPCDPPRPE